MDWNNELAEAGSNIENFRTAQSAASDGFTAMHRAAMTPGALDSKQKELIALAIGISKQCVDCIGFHVRAAIKAGATREEIAEVISVCMMMGGGPAYMYGVEALEAYDQLAKG
jgi:AhpD family alkylhydroperoxidase